MEYASTRLRGRGTAAFLVVSAVCSLAACDVGSHADAQRANGEGPAPTPGQPSSVALHMAMRYALTSELRDALIVGELGPTREVARELATPVPLRGLPERARSHVLAVHVHAEEIAEAPTLLDASAAFGALMSACGECHAAVGVRATVSSPPLPPRPDRRTPGPMRRHEEATIAMWEGLLVGSIERFDAGARMLADAPLTAPERRQPPEQRRLAERARSYARAATRAADLTGRAEQYGLLLSTCAECHAVARPRERRR